MALIHLVDDDYALEILAAALRNTGHDANRIPSVEEALDNIDQLVKSDLLLLDVMMSPPSNDRECDNGRTAGLAVYRSLRQRTTAVPVLIYTASSDRDAHAVFARDPNTQLLSKLSAPPITDVISRIEQLLDVPARVSVPRTFIVHGQDDVNKLALKNYLQNVLEFPEPIILHEQPGAGRTIIEKLEDYADQSDLVFVILRTVIDIKLST